MHVIWLRKLAGSSLVEVIQEELIRYFRDAPNARAGAEVAGVNRSTVSYVSPKLREVVLEALDAETPKLMAGEIEIDKSYFGDVRKYSDLPYWYL